MNKLCCSALLAALLMVSMAADKTEAVECTSIELNVCLPAIVMADQPPSALCCRKSLEQRPCFCEYLRDPNLKQFFSNAADRKVAKACGLPYPVCGF